MIDVLARLPGGQPCGVLSANVMSARNIDHIRPCSSFDLTKTKEQYKCFNYTNLQPLWAKENLVKRSKKLG